ncbi:hypothetical protein [Arcobacter arenosus]|uniref:hypothetical protein n=1 Tax=Arcobacter arenosus TaxID=2576037 RepID=UPI003BAB5DEC
MIEYRYFSRLNKENQKKIIEELNDLCRFFIDENKDFTIDDYDWIVREIHFDICDTLREQSTVNNKVKILDKK